MTKDINLLARLSLTFLWLFTALTSALFAIDIGYEVLAKAGFSRDLSGLAIYSGSFLDLFIAVWLITGLRLKSCYLFQLLVISVYSLLLTWIDANFWLHPFGPLTKNIPILVLVYILYKHEVIKGSIA